MRLTVLVDNNTFDLAPPFLLGQSALSYLIETNGRKILFDVGYGDTLLANARYLDLDLSTIDCIVLSHSHIDHTDGLNSLIPYLSSKSVELIAHPNAFLKRFYPEIGGKQIGMQTPRDEILHNFKVNNAREPYWLTEDLCFLGEIEKQNDFEKTEMIGELETGEKDENIDDSALVYRSKHGLVIITGCSHSGVCNMIEYAKKVCNEQRIVDVVGGFHLLNPDSVRMQGTIDYFKDLGARSIHPCHCTDLGSKIKLSQVIEVSEVGSGLVLEYD